jgi:NhaP-type Na+/H+ or K+/H+ antiporter
MHEATTILGIALVVLGYGWFSKLLSRFNISGPMVFTGVGVLLSPLVFGVQATHLDSEVVQIIAEVALILVLFSDAATLNLGELKRDWKLPARLLFIGLPITILVATFVAKGFFPAESTIYLLLMALLLAPTDAALGKAVVSDTRVAEKIRTTINVESGLNDGIVFPIVITVISMITGGSDGQGWLPYVAKQIAVGAVAGGLVGYFGAMVSTKVLRKNWMEHSYQNLVPIALAIFSYYLAEHFGGNGFISAFFAGLFLGNNNQRLRETVEDFSESEGELLILISFLVFGIAMIPVTIGFWNLTILGYALLSLTFLRMVPVAISLIGSKLDFSTILFIGWFGPRGIASILYVLIVVHKIGTIENHETVYAVVSLTILLSIVLHGVSAKPFAALYAKSHSADG